MFASFEGRGRAGVLGIVLLTAVGAGCRERAQPEARREVQAAQPAASAAVREAPNPCGASTVTVPLALSRDTLALLFPVRSRLPLPYSAEGELSRVPLTLEDSIQGFVRSSLERDQFSGVSLKLVLGDSASTLSITATGCNLADYSTQLPKFLEAGVLGLNAWSQCVKEGVCGPNQVKHRCAKGNKTCAPWAFFLPLGLPLTNHSSVLLLDYPPADALCGADYLGNFTMQRWAQVYAWQKLDAARFEALVDVQPIAASGSGEADAIRKAQPYFAAYRRALLGVLASPPSLARRPGVDFAGRTLPVMVSGSPAHKAWGEVLGRPSAEAPKTGDTGETTELVPNAKTAWIAVNHPDVTAYQCCPKDPACNESWSLVDDERLDFEQVCWLKGAVDNPQNPFAAKAECSTQVQSMTSALCTQARLDYSFDSNGNCKCAAAAKSFCASHGDNACPNGAQGPYESCAGANAAGSCPSTPPSPWFRCQKVE